MTEHSRLHEAADIALAIEASLRSAGQWRAEPPSAAALASSVPFCADTLEFTQWLQFVFLPKLGALIEQGQALPSQSAIAVMARAQLAPSPVHETLIQHIERFDRLITAPAD